MNLTDRELNQVLAALRYWQRIVTGHFGGGDFTGFIPEEEAIFFEDDLKSLDEEEIDALCIKINCEEEA